MIQHRFGFVAAAAAASVTTFIGIKLQCLFLFTLGHTRNRSSSSGSTGIVLVGSAFSASTRPSNNYYVVPSRITNYRTDRNSRLGLDLTATAIARSISSSDSDINSDSDSMPKDSRRPGVEAAVRLAELLRNNQNDNLNRDADGGSIVESTCSAIETQYKDMLFEKNGTNLQDLDQACDDIAQKLMDMDQENEKDGDTGTSTTGGAHCTFTDLTTVLKWKFAKGKPRPLWKHLNSNSNAQVILASKRAFAKLRREDDDEETNNKNKDGSNTRIRGAIDEFSKLKGIGPASATAFLSLYRPDLCIFMDDEVIECLYSGKRAYTINIYLEINQICQDFRDGLQLENGGDTSSWTTRRVGKTLWTAARLSLCKDRLDLTLPTTSAAAGSLKNSSSKNSVEIKRKHSKSDTSGYKKKGNTGNHAEEACVEGKGKRRKKAVS